MASSTAQINSQAPNIFIQQVIIDNIKTKHTHDAILNHIKHIVIDKFTEIKYLKQGGFLISPSHAEHITYITHKNVYPTNT